MDTFGTNFLEIDETMNGTHHSIRQAALALALTEQQVRNLCKEGKLKAEKFGNVWAIPQLEVEHYRSEHTCGITEDQAVQDANPAGKPIALSFFSGAMGMDIGLEQAGFDIRLCCEVDNACRKTILKNYPKRALIGDIRMHGAASVRSAAGLSANEDIDLVVGGPPCQAFSTAGRRKGLSDRRGNLVVVYLEMILALRPKYAVLENVRGILSAAMSEDDYHSLDSPGMVRHPGLPGGVMDYLVQQLERNGYGVSFNLYNAANFGTPQLRERVIMIASRDGRKLPFLSPTHSLKPESGLAPWVTLREALAGLEGKEQQHLAFPEKRLRFYRLLGPGQNWRNLSPELQKEAMGNSYYSGGGKSGFFRRLDWDRPSPTLVTHPAMPATDLAHPEEDRPLSIEEYKCIQQFPEDWKIEGSLVEKYRQIGNAVPVGLGRAIGLHLLADMQGLAVNPPEGFKYSRYSFTDHHTWLQQWQQTVNASKQVSLV